jgi:hypothetical protein
MKPIDTDVPFISNTPDDKHCLPASYAMIRRYFDPDLEIDWDVWSETVGFVPDKGSWSMAGLMWFKDNGYDVVHFAAFDYGDFALRGPEYLLEALDEELAKWDIEFTDFEIEQARAVRFLRSRVWKKQVPIIDDIRSYLKDGYLVKCSVNLNALNGKPGYLSHAVVVKGITETDVILHDPGLPARPNRHVLVADFVAAWGHPYTTGTESMDAIRKQPNNVKTRFRLVSPAAESPELEPEPLAA